MERIRQKIARIRENLALIHSIQDNCVERFQNDPIYRGALLHYLYLLSDGCIVLAELVIKRKDLRLPQSYAEAFEILGDNGVLKPAFASDFARIAGFRNFLAHDYERLEGGIICGQVLGKINDVDEYLRQIEEALEL
jgi:uncharacterized protein YutE (UPF0331/DUF86 family)